MGLKDKTCDVISREITNIECTTPHGEDCGAAWKPRGGAALKSTCDNCLDAGSMSCTAQFKLSVAATVSISISEGHDIETDVGFQNVPIISEVFKCTTHQQACAVV